MPRKSSGPDLSMASPPSAGKKKKKSLTSPKPAADAAATTTSTTTRMMLMMNQEQSTSQVGNNAQEDHPDLAELEQRLTEEVDEEFFQDPRKFHTLHRVIDVLGMQLADVEGPSTTERAQRELNDNPAYRGLKDQQQMVEEAIEHLALIHCADLNGSVVQVGRVARQFHDAVTQVRHLRKQVKEIQETLGAGNATPGKKEAASASMSLRELWLKKLEAEAVLSLLSKLDQIRAAPRQFDTYLQQHRIGAAVTTVAQALDTMFSSDVSQVQALHKIMEQLMMRKQRAEEVVWELLLDVLFLRTGNGPAEFLALGPGAHLEDPKDATPATTDKPPTAKVVTINTSTDGDTTSGPENYQLHGMVNPFLNHQMRFAVTADLQLENQQPQDTQDWQDEFVNDDDAIVDNMMIPPSTLEAEFDLEMEERRHLEDHHVHMAGNKPEYRDHVLALRTLVECLVRLRRLDDVERIITDGLDTEIPALVQREQARTFFRVEGSSAQQLQTSGRYAMLLSKAGATTDLRDFRKHLVSVVSAFGNVHVRLSHLAQIVRRRVSMEKGHSNAYSNPSSALAGSIQTAKDVMERELKSFLNSCLHEPTEKETDFSLNNLVNINGPTAKPTKAPTTKHGLESGLFSLGIIDMDDQQGKKDQADAWLTASTASRRHAVQGLSTPNFVSEVLFAKTTQNGTPQIRHALFFRKALAKWQQDHGSLRSQLAKASMEDTTLPSYSSYDETPSLEFLDNVIQRDLLPVLQEEAVNGTVQALERPDAFDPVLDRNVYARSDSNEPQDVDMCRACTALYNFTGPLFLALHRLPKGGDMYLPLVAVLEHVILTFISRVKQQVSRLCTDKTSLQLIMDSSKTNSSGDSVIFGTVMERRKSFAQLVLAYADGDLLEAAAVADEGTGDGAAVPPLTPSASDTPSKGVMQSSKLAALDGMDDLDLVGGVEREESNLSNELLYVKPYLEFAGMENLTIKTSSDEHLMKSACLAHSLLKLSSLLDSRLKVRSAVGAVSTKTLTNTRALREAIKTIKANGLKMAKICRADVLLQAVTRLAKVCNSSTVVARDAVRIPSSVNDLGEYMTAAADNLREAAGNAVTAYTFSALEQYIPLCLIQTVRVLAAGKGITTKAPLTMNGIEALDRSGSVLYRDLKGATSFDNSFWDIELAAVSFERSASFIAMMELEMAELEAYYEENRNDFSELDFQLMFRMNGPRRKGDIGRYHMLLKKFNEELEAAIR